MGGIFFLYLHLGKQAKQSALSPLRSEGSLEEKTPGFYHEMMEGNLADLHCSEQELRLQKQGLYHFGLTKKLATCELNEPLNFILPNAWAH